MNIFFKNTSMQVTFQYELSYILIPLCVFIYYYFTRSRPVLIYHIAIIGFIGIVDSVYKIEKYNGYVSSIINIIIHGALFLVLYDLYKYDFDIYSLLLLVVANMIIIYLHYWPYEMDRYTTLFMYNISYLSLFLIHKYVGNLCAIAQVNTDSSKKSTS